jgi:hypothetical protein
MAQGKFLSFVGRAPGGGGSFLPIDPRAYGAVTGGTADDSIPISSAIAAGGLFLQSGIVYGFTWAGISAAMAAIAGNKFTIDGGGTLKLLSGSTTALTISAAVRTVLRGVVIDGNSQCGAHPTIVLASTARVLIDGVTVLGTTGGQLALSPGATVYNAINCDGIDDHIGN